jgi:threonine dehydrogenase-like Zn-dependent dehydrogenase
LIGLWLENKTITLRTDLAIPTPGPDEALVKVRLAGICATDLHMSKGYVPFTGIPGHEFVAEVVCCPGAPQMTGRRVVGDINVSSRCGPFAPALRLLESGYIDPRDLIQSRFPLTQGLDALSQAGRPGTMKVLIIPKDPKQT